MLTLHQRECIWEKWKRESLEKKEEKEDGVWIWWEHENWKVLEHFEFFQADPLKTECSKKKYAKLRQMKRNEHQTK